MDRGHIGRSGVIVLHHVRARIKKGPVHVIIPRLNGGAKIAPPAT